MNTQQIDPEFVKVFKHQLNKDIRLAKLLKVPMLTEMLDKSSAELKNNPAGLFERINSLANEDKLHWKDHLIKTNKDFWDIIDRMLKSEIATAERRDKTPVLDK